MERKRRTMFFLDIINIEIFHTLFMIELAERSFKDTELKNLSCKGHPFTYESTPNTDKDFYKNVMNNYANIIDGVQLRNAKELPHSTLTKDQYHYIREQISHLSKGEGKSSNDKFWLENAY